VESGSEKAFEKTGEAVKFKLIDRDKKEFARYCPTFARSYCSMKEGLRKLAEARNTRRLARDLSNEDVYVRKGAVTNLILPL
jgi:hypothetical protein